MQVLEKGNIQVAVHTASQSVWCEFRVRGPDDAWTTVLLTGAMAPTVVQSTENSPVCEDPELEWRVPGEPNTQCLTGAHRAAEVTEEAIALRGHMAEHSLTTRIVLSGEDGVQVVTRVRIGARTHLVRCMHHLYFAPQGRLAPSQTLDFAWLPALHRQADHLCADHFFRSPTVMVADRGHYAALLPDLTLFPGDPAMGHALDLRVADTALPGPRLSYGLCSSQPEGHGYFQYSPERAPELQDVEVSFGFQLWLGHSASHTEIVRRVASHLWRRHGRPLMADPRPQVLPFGEYGARYTFRHELPASVRTTERDGITCMGLENPMPRGAHFQARENDLHVGYGLRHYAQSQANPDLKAIADGILRLMTGAPRREGAFPCLYRFDAERYEGSLFGSANARHGYDAAAMSVTVWWLIKWIEDFGDLDRRALRTLVEAYCGFLMERQLESGAIPAYFSADLAPEDPLRESATTAISGAVLAASATLLRNPEMTRAAMRAGYFLETHILPGLDFSDFETLHARGAHSLPAIDPWSGIKPHGTLSLQWACDMYLALYRRTREELWLESGKYLLSVLSLYQQVWNPPHLSGYLFGGFGALHADGAWNDGRQARFSTTYADYYLATGETEYLERAVAACRASFALMDMHENHANGINDVVLEPQGAGLGYAPENIHARGPDSGYAWSGMNWSAGGALAASAYLERHLGSIFLDLPRHRAHGIDGMHVQAKRWTEDTVELEVRSALRDLPRPFTGERGVVLRAGGEAWAERELEPFDLIINGSAPFEVTEAILQSGVAFRLPG